MFGITLPYSHISGQSPHPHLQLSELSQPRLKSGQPVTFQYLKARLNAMAKLNAMQYPIVASAAIAVPVTITFLVYFCLLSKVTVNFGLASAVIVL